MSTTAGVSLPSPVRLEQHRDPRRPGRFMLAVWCVCGRFYTVTPFELSKRRHGCPDTDCGKGSE